MSTRYQAPFLRLAPAAAIFFLTGCGGKQPLPSNNSQPLGTAHFVVLFPAQRSRDIPTATQSVVLYITGEGLAEPVKRPINRPAFATPSRVEVEVLLPVGAKSIAALARSQSEGAGATLASGMTTVTVVENKTHALELVLQPGSLYKRRDPPEIHLVTEITKAKNATLTATTASFPYPQTLGLGLGAYSFAWTPPPTFLRPNETIDMTITASAGGSPAPLKIPGFTHPTSYSADVYNDDGGGSGPDILTSATVSYNLDSCFNGNQILKPCSAPLTVRNVTRHIATSQSRSTFIKVVFDYPSSYASVTWFYAPFEP